MRNGLARLVVALLVGMLAARNAGAQEAVDGFVAREHKSAAGVMTYRLFIPSNYDADKQYPLVVFLHGGSGVGTDNVKQISGSATYSLRAWTGAASQSKHPAFVLAPQAAGNTEWGWGSAEAPEMARAARLMLEIVAKLQGEFSIDAARLYITGQSLGGYGTWDVILRKPEMFAAAVPLCGGAMPSAAEKIKHMPIWVFHGADDTTVPVEESRAMVEALKAAGSQVKYTEYAGVGHPVWTKAYVEPGLVEWLFTQRKQ